MKISIVLEALTGSFETDMKRASKTAQKEAEQMRKKLSEAAKIVGSALGTIAAAAVTASVAITDSVAKSAEQMQRLSVLSGTSARDFQRYAAAARMVGVEQEKLSDIFKDVQDKVGDFLQTGGGALADFFENIAPRVGVTAEQFRKLSGPDALQLYVSSLEKAGVAQSEMVFYLEAIASDATLLEPILRNNGKAAKEFGDQAERLGVVLSREQLEALQQYRQAQRELGMAWEGLQKQLAAELAPTLTAAAHLLIETGEDATKASGAVNVLSGAFKGLVIVAAAVKATVQATTAVVAGIVDVAAKGVGILNAMKNISLGQATASDYLRVSNATKELADATTIASDAVSSQFSASIEELSTVLSRVLDPLNNTTTGTLNLESAVRTVVPGLGRAKEAAKATREEWEKYGQVVLRVGTAVKRAAEIQKETAERFAQQEQDLLTEISLLQMNRVEREAAIIALQAEEMARDATGQVIEEQAEKYRILLAELQRTEELRAVSDDVTAAFEDMAFSALDDFGSIGDAFKNLGEDLADMAKRYVAKVIAEFAQLQIINPIINSLFGGNLQTGGGFNLGSLFGGQGGGLGNLGSLFGLGASMFAGGGGFLGGVGAAAGAGGAGGAFSGAFGSMSGAGGAAGAGAGGGAFSGIASIPVIGWIIAGMMANDSLFSQGWRRNQSSLALPNGQSVTGGGNNSMLGDLLTAGAVNGLDSALQRLGVSDRIASLLSGSSIHARLFGRKAPRLTNSETTFEFGADGVGGGERFRTLEEGGLFRSDRRRWHDFALSGDALSAGQQIFEALSATVREAAARMAAEAPALLESSLQIIQEFDKKGKVKSTKYLVEAIGRSWEEATEEAALSRLNSEAIIGAIQSVFDDASMVAERWRSDAETLAEGADFLLAVAADVRAGFDLLGTGTLAPIVDLVEELAGEGEALAQVYMRIGVSTQLLEEALALTGTTLDMSREAFVRFATDITDAAGGIERAGALWSSYFQRFYSDAERGALALARAQTAADSQFGDIGLFAGDFTIDGGAQAFRELFESRLPTLSAEAIVQWLEAADALGVLLDAQEALNTALGITEEAFVINEAAIRDYASAVMDLNAELADLTAGSDYQRELIAIGRGLRSNIDALHEAARAAGLQGAREEDLAAAHTLAAMQAARALAALTAAGQELGATLYGSALGDIDSEIASLEAQGSRATSAVSEFGGAMRDAAQAASDGINLLLGDLSPLKDAQKLPLALQALEAGQIGPEDVLRIGQRLFASGNDYNQLFAQVQAIGDRRQQGGSGGTFGGGINTQTVSPALQALYEQRDELLAEQAALARRGQAFDLAQIVADIAGSTGESIADILANLTGGRASVEQFAADLGIDPATLQQYIEGLQAVSYAPAEIAESLRIEFDYLLDGLREILTPEAVAEAARLVKPTIGFGGREPITISDPVEFDPVAGPPAPPPLPGPIGNPEPAPERPIEREMIGRIESLEGTIGELLTVVAAQTGRTAEGVGELVQQRRGDALVEAAARSRSSRGAIA